MFNDALLSFMTHGHLNWIEIDRAALLQNLGVFRGLIGPGIKLMPVVKANAYGHGAGLVAKLIEQSRGADWLGVNSLDEAVELRSAGIGMPILLLGHVPLSRVAEAACHRLRLTVCNPETVKMLSVQKHRWRVPLHIKLETGTGRMGLNLQGAKRLAALIRGSPKCILEGYSTHFANIEDTTDPAYATAQIGRFEAMVSALEASGHGAPMTHAACTAAAMIFPATHRQLVRVGIGLYGLWPSREAMVSALERGIKVRLRPVLSWKTRVAQVKALPEGAYVGYGCSYRTTRATRLAVLPIGYHDGYDRRLSNTGHVLIRGRRAPLRGRVCMNMCMADVTDIRGACLEDEAVLIGSQGHERISTEQLASWMGTINYEVVSRIHPAHHRVVCG